jgi:sugar O-acyltransferase (sialic acid O-acetyltransferase NeuD family)
MSPQELTTPVIILGGGGHAKVLIEGLKRLEVEIIGIADGAIAGDAPFGLTVIGDDNAVFEYDIDEVALVNGVGSLPGDLRRRKLWRKFEDQGYRFAAVVHPDAMVAADVEWGSGVQIMAGAIIQPGTRIGTHSIINTGSRVDHDCIIGSDVHIAPGATLSGGVQVGDGAHIGTGAVVIQSVAIGAGSVLAAGAIVVTEVEKGERVASYAARPM